MIENRRTQRRKVVQGASLFVGVGEPTIACIIKDLSNSGARVKVDTVTALPDEIILMLSRDGHLNRPCRVVWRDGSLIGLQFIVKKSVRPHSRQALPPGEPQQSDEAPADALDPGTPTEP